MKRVTTPKHEAVDNLNISGMWREFETPIREDIKIKFKQGVLNKFSLLKNLFIKIYKFTLNNNKKKFQRKFKSKKLPIRLLTKFFKPTNPNAPGKIIVLYILGTSHESLCQYVTKL